MSALSVLWSATGRTHRALARHRVQFLYLHHVFRNEEAPFGDLLAAVARSHRFIGYSEAVERVCAGRVDRPYVTLSMDDGLKTCLRAATVMEEFGARACFFVITSMIGERSLEKAGEFCARKLHAPPLEFLGWDDVERLRSRGHEIGSHTATHARVCELDRAALQDEVGGSAELLRSRMGEARHFAWPYGRFVDASPGAVATVFGSGFVSCASAVRGCHVNPPSELPASALCIRRDHVLAHWPRHHSLFFMAKSSRAAAPAMNGWPASWHDRYPPAEG